MLNIGRDVFAAVGERGQRVMPNVDAGEQIFTKPPRLHFAAQIAVGACNELKIAFHFAVAAHGVKLFLFNGFEQHGLFIQAQFANLIQKQHAFIGGFQPAIALFCRACKRAFFVPKQRRCRAIAAQGGAVYVHKRPCNQVSGFFELVNAPRQHGFARARCSAEQNGRRRIECHLLNFGNHSVK